MPQLFKKMSAKSGLAPGTLVHIGKKSETPSLVTIIDYNATHFEERQAQNVEETFPYKDKDSVTWINIDGLNDVGLIEKLDARFGIHPLVLEDIVNTTHQPKFEDYGDYLFVILKMLFIDKKTGDIISEQVSLIIGRNYVLSFQEGIEGDVFDLVRERLRKGKGRIRSMGADYLAYALLDAVVDHYFFVLEKNGEKIEALEDQLMDDHYRELAREIHLRKREMIFLRKQIWPLREVLNSLQRTESLWIQKATIVYLRDVYDHIIQLMDHIDSFRDLLVAMHDIYLTNLSNRMNEIMKTLTIFTTLFIPLTFIVGIYGMNFKYMPELEWEWGYFSVLSLMTLVAVFMFIYFKKKKWL